MSTSVDRGVSAQASTGKIDQDHASNATMTCITHNYLY